MANPKYPVYIISKGRWESRLTSKALEHMKVPYKIVIEPQEYDLYAAVINPKKILVLPFSNLGKGSIPARNWVWEHSISIGATWHWILDDNINCFYRLNRNKKLRVESGTIFKAAEDFVDRYENVAIMGFHYDYFCKATQILPAYYLNSRVYSCMCIRNDVPFRWRGTYNEDTDLSIRMMKAGWCTVLFAAFLAGKAGTMTMKGGNTEDLYLIEEGRLKMARSLAAQHPDIVKVVYKFSKWHHSVDYSGFKRNTLKRKKGIVIPRGVDNYGMVLKTFKGEEDE